MPERQQTWKVKYNDIVFSLDEVQLGAAGIVQISPYGFNCLKDNRSRNAVVIDNDTTSKKITVEIEGEKFEIEIKDALDCMLEEMGFSKTSSRQIKEVKAPMPGMVLEISPEELAMADSYETADYKRVQVKLQSGKSAFVYIAADVR